MGFTIFLMDSKDNNVLKMDQKKMINMAKIDKMFKVMSTVSLLVLTHFYFNKTIFCTTVFKNPNP